MTLPLPRSLYAETARPAVRAAPLDGEKRASVAIVGGGFTGLSAALHLAERGTDVVVLEANEPGWGASGRNGGQVNPGLKPDPDTVERDFGPDLGGRMVRFSGNAPNVVFDLIKRHQIQCEAEQTGTFRAAFQARQAAEVRETAGQWIRRGAPAELLENAALHRATGTSRYTTALLDRRGGSLNPLGFACGLAQAAMQAGAAIHGATPARRVVRENGAWRVDTPSGTVRAERLILATNGYTDDLWPHLRRSIVPVFSAIAATETLPEPVAKAIMPSRSVLYEVASITVYYRRDRHNRLLMGGRGKQRDLSDMRDFQHLIRYAERLWPALKAVRWTHCWNGQLAITPDHYPHLHEPAPGVLAALGYNGRGVAMATATGALLARRVLGAANDALDLPITDIRAMPFHRLWRSAVAARMVYGRLRDVLGL
ncbi:MAG: FAD-binding oxidoreductase [Acidisphaera sp.]|nr:FAD-binding oxidoreductase [Acidisphaera sp.]